MVKVLEGGVEKLDRTYTWRCGKCTALLRSGSEDIRMILDCGHVLFKCSCGADHTMPIGDHDAALETRKQDIESGVIK